MRRDISEKELSTILQDTDLVELDSDGDWSRYRWRCGCKGVRFFTSDVCSMSWCMRHDPIEN
jgi:hypothetical protein